MRQGAPGGTGRHQEAPELRWSERSRLPHASEEGSGAAPAVPTLQKPEALRVLAAGGLGAGEAEQLALGWRESRGEACGGTARASSEAGGEGTPECGPAVRGFEAAPRGAGNAAVLRTNYVVCSTLKWIIIFFK